MSAQAASINADVLPEPVLVVDGEGRVLDSNAAARRQWSQLRRGQALADLVNDRQLLQKSLGVWLRNGQLLRSPLRLTAADGGVYSLSGGRLRTDHGQPPALLLRCEQNGSKRSKALALASEVQALRRELRRCEQRETRLREEKERAQVTLESIGDAVITCDAIGTIEYLNPAAERLTGWSLAAALNKPLRQVFLVMDGASGQPLDLQPAAVNRVRQAESGEPNIVIVRRGGQELYVDYSIEPIHARSGSLIGAVVVCRDVTETHRAAQQLRFQANHDALTGLVNRRQLERKVERLRRDGGDRHGHWLLFIDLDHFKQVNDISGHAAGDQLLRLLSALMQEVLRRSDTLARIGGDEFAVLLPSCPKHVAIALAEALRRAVERLEFDWEGQRHRIGASIGLVGFKDAGLSCAELMAAADHACYEAKQGGRDQVREAQVEGVVAQLNAAHEPSLQSIERAIADDAFALYGQPLMCIDRDSSRPALLTVSIEVLLRMPCAGGELLPAAFLPTACRNGLGPAIDQWVVRQVWNWLSNYPSLSLQVNLTDESICSEEFVDGLVDTLQSDRSRAERLCIDVADATLARFSAATHAFIGRVTALGSRIAIDGFRGGLGSIDALRRLPVQMIKIDRQLVSRIARDGVDRSVVAALAQIGQSLGMECVACGVQNQLELDLLHGMAVNRVQGFFTGRPRPLHSFTAMTRAASRSMQA